MEWVERWLVRWVARRVVVQLELFALVLKFGTSEFAATAQMVRNTNTRDLPESGEFAMDSEIVVMVPDGPFPKPESFVKEPEPAELVPSSR